MIIVNEINDSDLSDLVDVAGQPVVEVLQTLSLLTAGQFGRGGGGYLGVGIVGQPELVETPGGLDGGDPGGERSLPLYWSLPAGHFVEFLQVTLSHPVGRLAMPHLSSGH